MSAVPTEVNCIVEHAEGRRAPNEPTGDLLSFLFAFFYLNNSLAPKLWSPANPGPGWHAVWPALDMMFASLKYQSCMVASTTGQHTNPSMKLWHERSEVRQSRLC